MSASLYLYGVTRGKLLLPAIGVMPQAPPYVVQERDLVAVVSAVPPAAFIPENLAASNWLTERARAHDQVLVAVLRQAPVVPSAVACIFPGETEVRRYLVEHAERFEALLDHFDGKEEWLVKLLYQRRESLSLPEILTVVRLAEPGPALRAAAEAAARSRPLSWLLPCLQTSRILPANNEMRKAAGVHCQVPGRALP